MQEIAAPSHRSPRSRRATIIARLAWGLVLLATASAFGIAKIGIIAVVIACSRIALRMIPSAWLSLLLRKTQNRGHERFAPTAFTAALRVALPSVPRGDVATLLRITLDKLLIAALAGLETLGLYALALALGAALYALFEGSFAGILTPDRRETARLRAPLGYDIRMTALWAAPLGITLAVLVAFFLPAVPIIGGDTRMASQIAGSAAVLSLAAIPAALWCSAARWLRTNGHAPHAVWLASILTCGIVLTTIVLTPFGILALIRGTALIAAVLMSGAVISGLTIAQGYDQPSQPPSPRRKDAVKDTVAPATGSGARPAEIV